MSKPRFMQVEGHIGKLVRDTASNAILNVDEEAYEKHQSERNKSRLKDMRINKLENEMQDIKHLLTQILEKIEKE